MKVLWDKEIHDHLMSIIIQVLEWNHIYRKVVSKYDFPSENKTFILLFNSDRLSLFLNEKPFWEYEMLALNAKSSSWSWFSSLFTKFPTFWPNL